MKNIMKVISSLENRRILLKGATRKISRQEVGFTSFLKPLVTAGLSLMENVLRWLAKSVFVPLGLTEAASAADEAIQKEVFGLVTERLLFSNKVWIISWKQLNWRI